MNSTLNTISVRRILRTHWLRVCWSFFFPVIICIVLVAAFCCNGCSRSKDMDSDGVADASDNCPATANTNQADADGNGVGDACQGKGLATGDRLGYQHYRGYRGSQVRPAAQVCADGQPRSGGNIGLVC